VAGVLAPLLVEYGVTALGQRIHAKPPVVAAGYFYSLARLLPSVLFFATLSFMLVNLTGILVLGAGLTALLWAVILFGRDLLPTTLWMDLAQNGPVYLGATLGLLLLLLLTYRSTRRARRNRLAPVLTGLITVILTATLLRAAWAEQVLPGRRSAVSTWQRLRVPALAPGAFARGGPGGRGGFRRRPVPNLAWTDLHGKRLSLAALRGKPALVVLFQPHDSELLSLLHRLSELRQEFPADRLGMIVLCMAEDLEIAREAAALAGPAVSRTLPVVTDWGVPLSQNQTFYDDRKPTSVAAFQLRVQGSPVALLLDRDGREQTRDLPLDAAGWQDLRVRVRTFLEEADGEVD